MKTKNAALIAGFTFRSGRLLCVGLILTGVLASAAEPAKSGEAKPEPPPKPATKVQGSRASQPKSNDKVVKLDPFEVKAVFPSIEVHFTLSGQNLFDNLADPIDEAKVTNVEGAGLGERMGLQVGDTLTGLNGTPIRGLSIRQVAALVAEARKSGRLVWEIRRGFLTLSLRHNGKWETPLPGQSR
ncbi:MAG: PDZ domain-containing protein [Opitutaceae bacterium]|nr:PDZ domain-containing protein [Opitutaceae bacterium]MBP9912296.1 PDZ domain-containing protein [Opitutaceae bacterium]